jgi:hypothetical protein
LGNDVEPLLPNDLEAKLPNNIGPRNPNIPLPRACMSKPALENLFRMPVEFKKFGFFIFLRRSFFLNSFLYKLVKYGELIVIDV